jgi:chemotaxis signal transduction protein
MSGEEAWPGATAAKLRRTFDETFAEAPQATTTYEDLLVVRIGNDPFAVRLAETAGLHADRKIIPIPSPVPELLGIAALRGQITPIYALGALLGYRTSGAPRWFVLARAQMAVGLAFDVFETHTRIPQTSCTTDGTESMGEHVRGAAQVGDSVHPIIHIASVIETIARLARPSIPPK